MRIPILPHALATRLTAMVAHARRAARLAALLSLIFLTLATPLAQATDHVTLYVTDAQGTVVAELTPQGPGQPSLVTYEAAYRPYGQQALGVPQAGPGYTGHVNDPDSGLVYMQARYYDPDSGFLSVDPIKPTPGNIFSFNRYAYANDNPIVNIDPDGRETGRTLQAEWQMMGAKPNLTPDPVGKVIAVATIGIVALPVAYLIAPEAVAGAARIVIRQIGRKAPSRAAQADDSAGDLLTSDSPTAFKKVTSATRKKILARDQNADGSWTCATCGQKTRNPGNIHTGHKISRSKGGDLSDGNLRCEGAACNLSQGNRGAPKPGRTCAARGSCGAPYGRTD